MQDAREQALCIRQVRGVFGLDQAELAGALEHQSRQAVDQIGVRSRMAEDQRLGEEIEIREPARRELEIPRIILAFFLRDQFCAST